MDKLIPDEVGVRPMMVQARRDSRPAGTKRLSANIDAEVFDAATIKAKASGLTMNRVVSALLREYADGRIRVTETVIVAMPSRVDPY